ncbi:MULTISPECIES: hypothetical protein [unclassified Arsenophonus]|uniref:hypothetical protein n=1 Tax=unclassified Arsenophonus TaxID=2627083 RepID=UPI0028651592|nr:hypothetical protein [Arsenophonus sp.]MDR5615397.1 hypothetical protein [Arsenophonus sp.]
MKRQAFQPKIHASGQATAGKFNNKHEVSMENKVNSTEKLVTIGDRKIDREIAKYCLEKAEPAIYEVVTHLVKERCEKADVIEAAKTTAEAIVEGMTSIFRR